VAPAAVTVRRARPDDAAAVVELARAVAAEPEAWLLTRDWRSIADERRYLRAVRGSPDACVLVAQSAEGRIVGRLSLGRDPHPACAHVAELGIIVAGGSRRSGVGTALLVAAEEWARDAGVSKIELHVLTHNAAAIRLYEQLGYRHEGLRRRHFARDGELLDAVLMARDLAAARVTSPI
jgi:RimJ/RimL family protein N-acetyltransferase